MSEKKNREDSLENRMRFYESAAKVSLAQGVPAIIRIDGKAFRTFTRGLAKPFDRAVLNTVQETMLALCKSIPGCVFGYTQSDEITLVLTDNASGGWLGYSAQKMASVSASIATMEFNRIFKDMVDAMIQYYDTESSVGSLLKFDEKAYLRKAADACAVFDASAFSLPKFEVCNWLIWRQQDAVIKSISSAGRAYFDQAQLNGKSCNAIREMLLQTHGIDWYDYPADSRIGACCYKEPMQKRVTIKGGKTVKVSRNKWVIDREPPVFTQDRNFIERWL